MLLVGQCERSLRGILGQVSDPFEIPGNPQGTYDVAEVIGYRLAPRDHGNSLLLDLPLQLINGFIRLNYILSELRVSALKS